MVHITHPASADLHRESQDGWCMGHKPGWTEAKMEQHASHSFDARTSSSMSRLAGLSICSVILLTYGWKKYSYNNSTIVVKTL